MQNRYIGDLGDFGKYALLKALCLGNNKGRTLNLGVIWYLVPDESHNEDGKHIRYLQETPSNIQRFRNLDPLLYDTLGKIVNKGERNIKSIKENRILPSNTIFYEEPLTFKGMPNNSPRARQARQEYRDKWVHNAMEATKGCDIIFVDPDNGLKVKSVKRHHKIGPKYVFYEELLPYIKRGQSLIIYHHLCRNGTAEEQIKERLYQIKKELDVEDVFGMLYKRGTLRIFFVVPSDGNYDLLFMRSKYLIQETLWKEHFDLYTDKGKLFK